MSRFLRCDCCGAECPSDKTLQSQISIHDWTEDGGFEYENIDACPECTKKLQNFIYVLRHYPNNYVIQVNEEGGYNAF